jgi:hypothetical protein
MKTKKIISQISNKYSTDWTTQIICLTVGSGILMVTSHYLINSIASLSYIKENVVQPTGNLDKPENYLKKVLYLQDELSVFNPARDPDYEIYPKNCVRLNRKVEKYERTTRMVTDSNGHTKQKSEFRWVANHENNIHHLKSIDFYCRGVYISQLFIDPIKFSKYYRNTIAFDLKENIPDFNKWIEKIKNKLKQTIKMRSFENNKLYFDSLMSNDKRVIFDALQLDENSNYSIIGYLEDKNTLDEINIKTSKGFSRNMIIKKGEHTADQLINDEIRSVEFTSLAGFLLGLCLNSVGFYFFNQNLYQTLYSSMKMNKYRSTILSSTIGIIYSISIFYINYSLEKSKFSNVTNIHSINSLKNEEILRDDFTTYEYTPDHSNKDNETEYSNSRGSFIKE